MRDTPNHHVGFGIVLILILVMGLFIIQNRHLNEQVARLSAEVSDLRESALELSPYMRTLQLHVAKLWFAGKARNWELAKFQHHEIEETFESIEKQHLLENGVNVTAMIAALINPPMVNLESAIGSHDADAFKIAYQHLIESCNRCHVATRHSYIRISVPVVQPVPNQNFREF